MRRHEPLIHVGYYKTGTTWLQVHLFGARGRGFIPVAPPEIASPKLAAKHLGALFFTDARGQPLSPYENRNEEARICMDRWGGRGAGVPVVSHQRLVGNPFAGGFDAPIIADRIASAFPDARILIIVREQFEMIYSTYRQYLKCGGLESAGGYFNRRYDNRLPGFSLAYFRYSRLVSQYLELFGRDRVMVLPYEMFASEPCRFVGKICDFSGAPPPTDLDFDRRENVARSAVIASRSRFLNIFAHSSSLNGYSPYRNGLTSRLVSKGRAIAGRLVPERTEKRFKATTIGTLRDSIPIGYFAEDNRKLAQLTGLDLAGYGYEMTPDSGEAGADHRAHGGGGARDQRQRSALTVRSE